MKPLILVVSVFALAITSEAVALPRAVIFDVDDTLVDVNYRTLEVLQDIAKELDGKVAPGVAEDKPLDLSPLLALEIAKVDYYCDLTLKNSGLSDATLIEHICGSVAKNSLTTNLWGQKFFAPAYLKYDHIISGARQFVSRLAKDYTVLYLTARSTERNGPGTLAQLRYYGFPQLENETPKNLITKSDSVKDSDVLFKQDTLASLRKEYLIAGAFDDSRSNANMFRKNLDAKIPVVRPTKDVKDETKLEPGIIQITNYVQNAAVETKSDGTKVRTVERNDKQLDDIVKAMSEVTE